MNSKKIRAVPASCTRETKEEHASLEPVRMLLYGYAEKLVGGNPFEAGKKLDAIPGDGGLVSVLSESRRILLKWRDAYAG